MSDWSSGLSDAAALGAVQNVATPLDALGIDPDEARLDRAGTMAALAQSPLQRAQAAYKVTDPGSAAGIITRTAPAANTAPTLSGATGMGMPAAPRPAAAMPAPKPFTPSPAMASLAKATVPPSLPPVANTTSAAVSASGGTTPSGAQAAAQPAAATPVKPLIPPRSLALAPRQPNGLSPMQAPGQSLHNYGVAGLEGLQHTAQLATQADQQIPVVDTESPIMEKQLQADEAAHPLAYDPATGKRLAAYKPSVGQEILRGVKAGAIGLATGGLRGAILGGVDPQSMGVDAYGAPTDQYARDVAQNEQKVGADNQALSEAQARFKAAQDARKAQATGLRADAGTYKDVVSGAQGLQNADSTAAEVPIHAQQVYNGSPAAKAIENQSKVPQTYEELVTASHTDPDPVKREQYAQSALQIEQAERRKFQGSARAGGSGAEVPGAPAPAAGGVSGEAYLRRLPAGFASQVRAIGEGRVQPPNSRSKQAMALMSAVTQAYPDYDATRYGAYQQFRKSVGSGQIGTAINSFNTALGHLDRLEANIPDNTRYPLLNRIENAGRHASGSPQLKGFEDDVNAVSSEVARAYKGGAISEGEERQWQQLLSENDSPAQLRQGVAELRQLLQGKLQAYQRQWSSVRPSSAVQSPLDGLFGSSESARAGGGNGGQSNGYSWDAHPEVK